MPYLKWLLFIFQDAREVIRTMKTSGLGSPSANSASIDAFREACHQRFPYAVDFFPPNTYTGPQVSCISQWEKNDNNDYLFKIPKTLAIPYLYVIENLTLLRQL